MCKRKLRCVIVSTDLYNGVLNGAGIGDVEGADSSHQPIVISDVQPDPPVSVHDEVDTSLSIHSTPSSRLNDNDGAGDDEVEIVLNPTASRTSSSRQVHIRDAGPSASKRKRVLSPSDASYAEADAHRRSTRPKPKL